LKSPATKRKSTKVDSISTWISVFQSVFSRLQLLACDSSAGAGSASSSFPTIKRYTRSGRVYLRAGIASLGKLTMILVKHITINRGDAMTDYVELEIRILPRIDDGYPTEAQLSDGSHFSATLASDLLPWHPPGKPIADGRRLFNALFRDGLHAAWERARGLSEQRHVRLYLDAGASALHPLPWELLHDGQSFLAAHADTPFSRYLPVDKPGGDPITTRPLRALVAVANPANLTDYNLAPLDAAAERAHIAAALNGQPCDVIPLEPPVTLKRLETALRTHQPHLLHLLAHGRHSQLRSTSALYLEDGAGNVALVKEADFCDLFERLGQARPHLVFLAACESAKRDTVDAFAGIAPKLVHAGVPAVVGMQDTVSIGSARRMTPAFYAELFRSGAVDSALNAARSHLLTGERADAAVPVLFMRLEDGRLFGEEGRDEASCTVYNQQGQQVTNQVNVVGENNQVIVNQSFTEGIHRLPTDYASCIENFIVKYLKEPFGGRDVALDELDNWLAESNAAPYLLLTAPAGRGKSTLLVHWIQHLIKWESYLAVIFLPVSVRFKTNQSSVVFASLAARLAELHRRDDLPSTSESVGEWRGIISDYLSHPLPDGRALLVILDGLDEAADWDIGPDLFPLDPPPKLRILLSARYTAERPNADAWKRALNWDQDDRNLAQTLDLPLLDQAGIADVLNKRGVTLDVNVVAELYRLSEGEPLLISLYVEALQKQGEDAARLSPDDLQNIEPGLAGYFEKWWEDQKELWGEEKPMKELAVREVFNLLSCALGPLTAQDLLFLSSSETELDTWVLEEVRQTLSRLIIEGEGVRGYTFAHPKLSYYFYDKLKETGEASAWEARFLSWGQQTIDKLKKDMLVPSEVPSYIIQNYGAHLFRNRESIEGLSALACREWMCAWRSSQGSYSGFLYDVERVWKTSDEIGRKLIKKGVRKNRKIANVFANQVKSLLCFSIVASLSSRLPTGLPALLVRDHIWHPRQAMAYTAHISDADQRVQARSSLLSVDECRDRLDPPDIDNLCTGILSDLQYIENKKGSEFCARLLLEVLPYLSQKHTENALKLAYGLEKKIWRIRLLGALLPHVTNKEQKIEVAKKIILNGNLRWRVGYDDAPHFFYTYEIIAKNLPIDILSVAWQQVWEKDDSESNTLVWFLNNLSWHISDNQAENFVEFLYDSLPLTSIIKNIVHLAPNITSETAFRIARGLWSHLVEIEDKRAIHYYSGYEYPGGGYSYIMRGCGLAFLALANFAQEPYRQKILEITDRYLEILNYGIVSCLDKRSLTFEFASASVKHPKRRSTSSGVPR
jgi:CHAT domain-containing protein